MSAVRVMWIQVYEHAGFICSTHPCGTPEAAQQSATTNMLDGLGELLGKPQQVEVPERVY